uniref:Elongation of very long chain fatty acids protein n=1 Tax=Dicentrarchus labrax TaxID=13489 RepID=A0A8C4EJF8_DICLA
MASVWQSVLSAHQRIVDNGDKRTDPWLLIYSPVPVSIIILLYLCVVWAGPRLMKDRQPVDLKVILIIYNFAMVGLSAYMFYEVCLYCFLRGKPTMVEMFRFQHFQFLLLLFPPFFLDIRGCIGGVFFHSVIVWIFISQFLVTSWLSNYSYLCQPVDYSSSPLAIRMAKVCWWFFFSKVIELSDTIFFILRKKSNQLTFLHVYHHATMILNWWAGVKYVAGGQSFFIGLLNTFVHTVMYSYYGLAAIGPHMQKYLWWKRYLTSLQLVQFVLFILYTGQKLLVECDFPTSMNILVFCYCITLIILFSNFYYQSYLNKKKQK